MQYSQRPAEAACLMFYRPSVPHKACSERLIWFGNCRIHLCNIFVALKLSFHSFPPASVYFFKPCFFKMHGKLCPAWHWKLSLMNFIFCCKPDNIFSSLFVIRLQSFLSKDLWEKHILRTSGPGILQLSVMPLEAHRGSLFYIKCLKQGMLIESIWNCPVTDGGADIKLGRTSP